jgi:Tfp pilus assembly protein PilZ
MAGDDDLLKRAREAEERLRALRDRRREPRVDTALTVEIKLQDWTHFQKVATVNMSKGGLMYSAPEPSPQLGTAVEIVLALPDGQTLRLPSLVKHVLPPGSKDNKGALAEIGVMFENVPESTTRKIEALLEKHVPSAKPGEKSDKTDKQDRKPDKK